MNNKYKHEHKIIYKPVWLWLLIMKMVHNKIIYVFWQILFFTANICNENHKKIFPVAKRKHGVRMSGSVRHIILCIAKLNPQSPRHFAWKPAAWASQSLGPRIPDTCMGCYISERIMTLPPHRLLIYAHSTSCTLPTCDTSLSSLMVPAPAPGDFMELVLLYM